MSSVKVTLAGTEYECPMLNIGQLERATELLVGEPVKATFGVLRIAMERATPKPSKFEEIEPTRAEVEAAVKAIMVNAGFRDAESPNPPAQA